MKKLLVRVAVLLSAVMLALGATRCVQADEASPSGTEGAMMGPTGDEWKIIMPTYVWASGIEGDVTLKGTTASLDVPFDKILDHTDAGFAMYIEVRKEKFGFYFNPSYMALSADGKSGGVNIRDQFNLWIVEGGGFYQVGKWGQEKPLTLDAYAGMRWWNMHNNLKIGAAKTAANRNMYDPMIGLRVRKYFTENFFGSLRMDVGGFDIGHDTSRFSWSATPLVGYDFNKYFTGMVGWRELATEFENGSGTSKNGANLKLGGVMIGFNFDLFGWLAKK